MKNFLLIFLVMGPFHSLQAQDNKADTMPKGIVTVSKDPRIETLGKKMAEYNESLSSKLRSTRGYRLMLLSTNDRSQALQIRTQLLQLFPDQQVYMVFQSPYIKLKMGNFLEKGEADDVRKQVLAAKIITGNIYIVPETVEVKGDKLNQTDDQQ
jgi:hypothetical protein